jgi:phosphoesterase RecJ-like protein
VPIDWSRLSAILAGKRRVLVTSHVRPDGDALGSELAMAAVLEQLGKEVAIVNAFDVPPHLKFLDPQSKLQRLDADVPRCWIETVDLFVVLDTCAWAQLGGMAEVLRAAKAAKVVLDHHVSSDDLGAEVFKDVEAEATGRLVYAAAEHLGVAITPEIAVPLFAALATDTGWFRFNSATAETYRLAARLIDAGAVPENLYRNLYENESLGRVRLAGRGMARAQTELGGRLIHTWISAEDFPAAGALASDTEDLVNRILAVGGVEVAAIFVEQRGGGCRVSLRSRSRIDCARLAEQFGGGGHLHAAGATLQESLQSAQSRVLDAVRAAMR